MADAQEPRPLSAPSDGIWAPALKEGGVAFGSAALLLVIFYIFAFRWIHPEFVPFMDREATKLIVAGKDLIPVSVGSYQLEKDSAIIEDFNGDEAILALPRGFQAEDYPFIKVNLEGFTRYSKFKILWRRADDLPQTHALEFNRSSDEATQIAMVYGHDNYRGQIADIALLFYDGPALAVHNNNDTDIAISSLEFRPFSPGHAAEQIFEDWTNPPLWAGSAHNLVEGAHINSVIKPNTTANLLLVMALLLLRVLKKKVQRRRGSLAPYLVVFFMVWGGNELLRWDWRIAQLTDSFNRYLGSGSPHLYSDVLCARFVSCQP